MVGTVMEQKNCDAILSQFGNDKRNLLPILQQVQDELGYISEKAVEDISRCLRISENEIFGVASFYKHFKFAETGKCTVKVCMGTACHVRGALNILDEFKRKLGIEPGQTTSDRLFSLETVNCLGACALGPIAVLDGDYHGQMKVKAVEPLIKKVKSENLEEGCAGNEQQ